MFISKDISFFLISLGCSKNLVDSEKINGEMLSAGFKSAKTREEADILIINTCAFINDAKKESIDVIFESINLRDSFSKEGNIKPFIKRDYIDRLSFQKKIVVFGCLSQRYFVEIKKDIPEIDFVYRLIDDNFVKLLSEKFNIKLNKYFRTDRIPLINNQSYSYIKISEGCSNNCSYCSIPLIKGNLTSFPFNAIVRDAQQAVQHGARELIIIAQDIASYSYNGFYLPDVVERLSIIDGVEWIRLLYCHPDNINKKIIRLLKNNVKVVKYIDIPLQHVSMRILRSMGRKGDFITYYRMISNIREIIPEIRIRSTFMVGYPGDRKSVV